jgi:hypothetical protein
MHPPVQFGLKNVREIGRFLLVLVSFLYLGIAVFLAYLFQLAQPDTAQLIWSKYVESPIIKQVQIAGSVLFLLLFIPLIFYASQLQWNIRIRVDDESIRFESKLPFLAKWIDWSFPLTDFNGGVVRFTVVPLVTRGSLPLIAFTWGSYWRRHVVRVSDWEQLGTYGEPVKPVGETSRFFQVPKGFFSWPQRKSPEILQKQFESIPLINALRRRGVDVPPLNAINRSSFGTDLFTNTRLKHGVYAMVGVSFAATAAHFFAAHDYLIGRPPWSVISVFSVTCAAAIWAWLWQGRGDLRLKKSERVEFLAAQVFVALVMAVLLTWFTHVIILGNTKISQAPVGADFILDIKKHQLRPSEQALATHPGLEPIKLDFGKEYWQAQPKDTIVPIEVRRNFWLRLWQYDREPLLDRMREFYLKR